MVGQAVTAEPHVLPTRVIGRGVLLLMSLPCLLPQVQLQCLDLGTIGWYRLALVISLGSVLEGVTQAVDNLVLPIFTVAGLLACT
jgi:hypothetical protein